jgi:carboxyl-terminal processing protease
MKTPRSRFLSGLLNGRRLPVLVAFAVLGVPNPSSMATQSSVPTVSHAPFMIFSELGDVQVKVPSLVPVNVAFASKATASKATPVRVVRGVRKPVAKPSAKKKKKASKVPATSTPATSVPVVTTGTTVSSGSIGLPLDSPTTTTTSPVTASSGIPASTASTATTTTTTSFSTSVVPSTSAVPVPTVLLPGSATVSSQPTQPTQPTLPTLVPGAAATKLPSRRKLDPTAQLPPDLTAAEYVDVVVGWAERYSVRRRQVDMAGLRARVEAATANAVTIADTYIFLQLYLEALGDNHSFLYTPAAAKVLLNGTGKSFGFQLVDSVMFPLPGSPALLAGIRDRDRLIAVNGEPYVRTMRLSTVGDTSTFTVQHAGDATPVTVTVTRGDVKTSQLPSVRALDDRLGFIDLPGSTGTNADEAQFTAAGQVGIRRVDEAGSRCGWVLDLRRNTGGFPYSMMAAIALLYGNAELGGTVDVDGNLTKFSTLNGALRINGGTVIAGSAGFPSLSQPNGPIAILTSSSTASAGELAIVGFAGRPGVRTFGDATFGVPSGNVGRSYPDGSFLAVTNTLDIDRTGRTYNGPLAPDEAVVMDWSLFGTSADPVLAAATRWARAQPACSVLGP